MSEPMDDVVAKAEKWLKWLDTVPDDATPHPVYQLVSDLLALVEQLRREKDAGVSSLTVQADATARPVRVLCADWHYFPDGADTCQCGSWTMSDVLHDLLRRIDADGHVWRRS